MRRIAAFVLLFVFACSVLVGALTVSASGKVTIEDVEKMLKQGEHEPGQILVYMEDDVTYEDAKKLLIKLGFSSDFNDKSVYVSDAYAKYGHMVKFCIKVAEEKMAEKLLLLSNSEGIDHACPNYSCYPDEISSIEQVENVTLDPETTSWAFDKMGVVSAWEKGFTGNDEIIVAVLDTGYNEHVDVSQVDLSLAYNVSTEGAADDIHDYHGHGTFVVGQIAADLNGTGVNGICRNIKVVPIKISHQLGNDTISSQSEIEDGVAKAREIQASVINLSFSMYFELQSSFAGVFATSAGNDGGIMTDVGKCNDNPNWLVVGSSTQSDAKRSNSNYSALFVDLFAPGDSIWGLQKDGTSYRRRGGTSMATPYVAAAAALIMSHATHLSSSEVCQLLIETVDPIPAFSDKCVSGGRLNINNAVTALYNEVRPAYSFGDINGDSRVDSFDYSMARAIVLGTYTPSSEQSLACDVNQDGVVNAFDYQMIRAFVLQTLYFPPY